MTVDLLHENVPHEIPGIVFLSGGQTEVEATAHLNMMNNMSLILSTVLFLWACTPSYHTRHGLSQDDVSVAHNILASM